MWIQLIYTIVKFNQSGENFQLIYSEHLFLLFESKRIHVISLAKCTAN